MKMIATPSAVTANQYTAFIHNCQRNRQCEPSYSAPLPGVPYLQLYVDFGSYKPVMVEFQLVDHCTGDTEQIFPSNYVVGKTPEGGWYGVFKYFNSPVTPVMTFVVWLSATVLTPSGIQERTFFSEMLVDEPCAPLTKIKSCHPKAATTTGFDVNNLYYGLPVNVDYLGLAEVRYFHIAWVRLGKVRELSNKGTFKSSLIRNFRTTIEKVHLLESELVPKWYKNELLAIYARGAVQINDGQIYLVSDLAIESINDDDLTWKPFAQLKETFRLFYGCDDSECIECCSPIVLSASVFSDESEPSISEGGGGGESGGDSGPSGPFYWYPVSFRWPCPDGPAEPLVASYVASFQPSITVNRWHLFSSSPGLKAAFFVSGPGSLTDPGGVWPVLDFPSFGSLNPTLLCNSI